MKTIFANERPEGEMICRNCKKHFISKNPESKVAKNGFCSRSCEHRYGFRKEKLI
jgi:hypothetical protein